MRKLLLFVSITFPVWGAWSYSSTVQVDRTKCGTSNLTNYPVLISVSNTALKTVANGGLVTSSSGYDIVVATSSSIGTYIPWEVEYWNGTTGIWIGWALLSSVNGSSAASNTTFGFAVGNSAITTQQNTGSYASTNVWDSYFKGVWHFPNGTSLSVLDSTVNANNGTLGGSGAGAPSTIITATSGQVDGAVNFANVLSSYGYVITVTKTGFPSGSNSLTMSGWANGRSDAPSGYGGIFYIGDDGTVNRGCGLVYRGGLLQAGGAGTAQYAGLPGGTWEYVVLTYDGTTQRVYGNGVLANSSAQSYNINTSFFAGMGNDAATYSNLYMTGSIDEVHISNGIARSGDWILSEFNNQYNPGNIGTPGFLIFASVASTHIRHQVSVN